LPHNIHGSNYKDIAKKGKIIIAKKVNKNEKKKLRAFLEK
jgi:hypothetical protein